MKRLAGLLARRRNQAQAGAARLYKRRRRDIAVDSSMTRIEAWRNEPCLSARQRKRSMRNFNTHVALFARSRATARQKPICRDVREARRAAGAHRRR